MQDTGLGLLGVDWEERIDFAKMRKFMLVLDLLSLEEPDAHCPSLFA